MRSPPGHQRQYAEEALALNKVDYEVIAELESRFPGIADRLCEDGRIRPGMAVAVDSKVSTAGVHQHLTESCEVHFLPAFNGG